MNRFWIGLALITSGILMATFAVYNIVMTIINYKMIMPRTISEFINYYFNETFKSINDITFLGVFSACGIILTYFGLFIIYLFKK